MKPSILQRVRAFFTGESAGVEKLRRQLHDANLRTRDMRAKIDAAATSDENKRHWANADSLGPNAALDTATRQKLRNRGRYEALNNSYCRGLVRTLANDLIGTGPRLQLRIGTGNQHAEAAKRIERLYAAWGRAVGLARKYRMLEKCSARDGEGFAILDTNERLKTPVKLDLRLMEAEQCCSPEPNWKDPYTVDGIKFDHFWQPVEYYFLKLHPGENNFYSAKAGEYETIKAEYVLHWFEQDRPGQMRGIPKITAGLPLFSQLRRFTLATLTSAEFAAVISGVIKSTLPPGEATEQLPDAWDIFEAVRGALLTLPREHDVHQMEARHPNSTYAEFKREILNEAGRGVNAPLNIVSGNSSGYNFSSGRLDHLPYQRGVWIEREDFRLIVADPVFIAWLAEAVMVDGLIPAGLPELEEWTWSWNWDGFDSIDQNKDATADETRLGNATTTYKEVLAARGIDEEEHFDQLAREKESLEARGLPVPWQAGQTASRGQEKQPSEPPAEEEETQQQSAERLRSALAEAGVDDRQAETVLELLFSPLPSRRHRHGRNGFHPVGGRT
jgi:lambda family phage portal protein